MRSLLSGCLPLGNPAHPLAHNVVLNLAGATGDSVLARAQSAIEPARRVRNDLSGIL